MECISAFQGHPRSLILAPIVGLSVCGDFVVLACVVFTQCQGVTDGQADRQTDRQTDIPTMANTGLA